ncbi:MAG: hemerythrin domain-containing protein [Candidatus Eiseniibacteriota bacterium]
MPDEILPDPELALGRRDGWPEALRFLVVRHPRATWEGSAALGPLAHYWLGRHAGFRELSAMLGAATAEFEAGRLEAAEFRPWFAPRLQYLLTHLDGHHQVEDYYYFPRLSAAEPRLAAGFAALAADHEELDRAIRNGVEAANALLTAPADSDIERAAGARYVAASAHLLGSLARHLDDEEDLVIPLLLDRGEDALGLG